MDTNPAQHFDRVAANYATSAVHANGPDLIWLVESLAPQRQWRVLDLGTGAGHAAMAVAPHVQHVDALDVAPHMLAIAADLAARRGLRTITFTQGAAEALPWPDATFDAACSRYSTHHWPELARALHETRRVLKPGAPLVLIDTISPERSALDTFVNTLELLRDPSHGRNIPLSEFRRLLHDAGFTVLHERQWPLTLETTPWLERAGTVPWRALACKRLLEEAGAPAQETFAIASDGSHFTLPVAVLHAVRR